MSLYFIYCYTHSPLQVVSLTFVWKFKHRGRVTVTDVRCWCSSMNYSFVTWYLFLVPRSPVLINDNYIIHSFVIILPSLTFGRTILYVQLIHTSGTVDVVILVKYLSLMSSVDGPVSRRSLPMEWEKGISCSTTLIFCFSLISVTRENE